MSLAGSSSDDALVVQLGAGNDSLNNSGLFLVAGSTVDGGAGIDRLYEQTTAYDVKRFERFGQP